MKAALNGKTNQTLETAMIPAAIIGVIGGLLGYIIGIVLSQFIGLSVFSTSINPRLEVVPLAVGISIGISLLASALPVRRAVRVEPAVVLRGE